MNLRNLIFHGYFHDSSLPSFVPFLKISLLLNFSPHLNHLLPTDLDSITETSTDSSSSSSPHFPSLQTFSEIVIPLKKSIDLSLLITKNRQSLLEFSFKLLETGNNLHAFSAVLFSQLEFLIRAAYFHSNFHQISSHMPHHFFAGSHSFSLTQ
jgi:hypothetical protein